MAHLVDKHGNLKYVFKMPGFPVGKITAFSGIPKRRYMNKAKFYRGCTRYFGKLSITFSAN